jgi:hypothetical protein
MTGSSPLSSPSDTYEVRLRQYKRRERMILWVGAGLLGLIALAAGDMASAALGDAPDWLVALMLTCLVLTGAFLALARVDFEWQATGIERDLQDGTVGKDDPLPASVQAWPRNAERWWNIGFGLIILAGLLFVTATWWAVVA